MKEHHTEIAVVGGGHAGCEAALVASRMGAATTLFTFNSDRIAWMPCNPSIGGIGKGHLVKEIDVLGGSMGEIIDKSGTQFRILNLRKGPAVQAVRAQADKYNYMEQMIYKLKNQENLSIVEGKLTGAEEISRNRLKLILASGETCIANVVIFCLGTFLNGLIHIGLENYCGGRLDEEASYELTKSFKRLNVAMGRLKTGTTPRLDRRTINFHKLKAQEGDTPVPFFSFKTLTTPRNTDQCYVTNTNPKTHRVILQNLDQSPLYSGKIKGVGPRYCPSIEDKIVRFKNRDEHQIFLEPEGENHIEVYPNGISTSLPVNVQRQMIRTIKSLENAEIVQPGYAVEYNFIFPEQLNASLQLEKKKNIFFAGQINGTSGYEEAAAQGLIAGINAVLQLKKEKPFRVHREEAYIGVLIDDIIHKKIREPYRIFTSRAERRLYLRNDNADRRLLAKGYELGLIDEDVWKNRNEKWEHMELLTKILHKERILVGQNEFKKRKISLYEYVKRPDTSVETLKTKPSLQGMAEDVLRDTVIEIKYEGYIKKEKEVLEGFKKLEQVKIPENMCIEEINGLTVEERERMKEYKPGNLREAEIYCGLRPSSIDRILFHVKKHEKNRKN